MRYRYPISSYMFRSDLRSVYVDSVNLIGFVDSSGVIQSTGFYDYADTTISMLGSGITYGMGTPEETTGINYEAANRKIHYVESNINLFRTR